MRPKKRCEIICRCNNISRESIEKAIRDGAKSMNEIFDVTSAGVGACGGSCRRKLSPMLDQFLREGTFPEKIQPDLRDKLKSKCDDDGSGSNGSGANGSSSST